MEDFTIEFISGRGRQMHLHQDTELLFVLEGSICTNLLDKQYILHADDVLVINSNNRHGWDPVEAAREDSLVCEIHFDYRLLREYLDTSIVYFLCNSTVEQSPKYDGLRSVLAELMSECAVNQQRRTLVMTSLVYKLLGYLSRYFLTDRAVDTGVNSDFRINELLQYINTNFQHSLSLDEMSSLLCISPSSFSRYFKKRTGLTFVKYLNNVRLHFAAEDLIYTDHPITVIAENNGFSNASAFCRSFKELNGISPLKYRTMHKDVRDANHSPVSIPDSIRAGDSPIKESLLEYTRDHPDHPVHPAAQEADQGILRITVDTLASVPLRNHWCDAISLGDCSEILTSSYRRQISLAKAELGFTYAKLEHLFDDSMKLRPGTGRNRHSHHVNNYDNLDEVFDFLVSENICPIIGLDNKPWSLTGRVSELLEDYRSAETFLDISECIDILSDILRHFVSRYGLHVVQDWMFDLWYDEYNDRTLGIEIDYTECFTAVCRCIKKHIPGAQVGGCGLSPSINQRRFTQLISKWAAGAEQPDFLSIYLYPYFRDDNDLKGDRSTLKRHSDFIIEELALTRNELEAAGWAQLPVRVMGWNLSLITGDPFNDSCGKAAILLSCMSEALQTVSLAAFDSLSDRSFSEHLSMRPITGSKGLMTHNGICKPAYFALQFMNMLEPFLLDRGPHRICTTDGQDTYTILCFNEKDMHINYYLHMEKSPAKDIHALFADERNLELIITIPNIPNGNYSIRQYCVSTTYGSVLDEWNRMGNVYPENDTEDIEYLRRITTPHLLHGHYKVEGRRLVLTETLMAHEFRLIRIKRDLH
ncbi:MAG: helix-turn-helix domain-containing protein [Lachnospiraceae bacterium]|nr:helix-turn-helix domain-containing protein [Lachnospiraceae bacterium]